MASSSPITTTKSPPDPTTRSSPSATLHQPASPRFPSNSRKIAIAIDLSDESAFAVKWAVDNYLRPGDSVILLHVRPTSVLYGADWGAINLTDESNVADKQRMEEDFTNMTDKKANELGLPLEKANVPYRVHIVKDHDMKERLCLEVERLGLSAVVMGSRGFGATRKTGKGRLGSVSDYCVRHCVCPVIVVRFGDDDDASAAGKDSPGSVGGKDALELQPVPEEEEAVFLDAVDGNATDGDKAQ